MIVHGNVELLSGFVDDELDAPQRQAVESHLADCPPCRDRIGALRRVVEELRSLEVVAPPAGLSGRVRRAVLFDDERAHPLRRTAESLRRWTDQPLLLPLFGVVTALAVLLYLFTAWSERAGHPGTRLVLGSEEQVVARSTVEVADRTFERFEGRWIERGVEAASAAETVDLTVPDPTRPELEPYRELGGRVVLLSDGVVIEVDFGPSTN